MTPTPSIRVNGVERPLPDGGTTLVDLLDALGRDPRAVAVELNGEIVRRERWAGIELSAGDRLEVVQFVQGG